MAKLVAMTAIGTWTRNSPVNGFILHGDDRKEADAKAQVLMVSEADAAFLEGEGLAKPGGSEPEDSDDGTGMDLGTRAGEFVQHYADADSSSDQATGLDTRQTTVFEAPLEKISAAGGANRAILTGDDGRSAPAAEEEAPAGRKPAARSGGADKK